MAEKTLDYRRLIGSCCKALRLSANLASRATENGTPANLDFLLHLLQNEVEYRRKTRVAKYLNAAGFPRKYLFEQFRQDEVQFPTDLTLKGLKELEFLKSGKNVVMYGGTGTGKTMLSICIGMEACNQGHPVKFYRTAALLNLLSESKASGTLSALHKKLNKVDILILDEFGYVPYDRTGAQLFFDYISEIEGKKTIILNTNLEFSRWVNVLYDEQMTAALIGRLIHDCHLILFPGENNRIRESSINSMYAKVSDTKS